MKTDVPKPGAEISTNHGATERESGGDEARVVDADAIITREELRRHLSPHADAMAAQLAVTWQTLPQDKKRPYEKKTAELLNDALLNTGVVAAAPSRVYGKGSLFLLDLLNAPADTQLAALARTLVP